MQKDLLKFMTKKFDYIKEIYNRRFNDNSLNKILKQGWGSKSSQILRFKILSEIGSLKNKSILDIGCGMGDFFIYIKKKGILNYTGIDISDYFINYSKNKFKEKNVNFICGNFLTHKFDKKYDYIFLSGTLNLKLKKNENMKIAKKFLNKAYNICKIGCSFNFLSSNVDFKNKKDFHYSSSDIIKICNKLSRNYELKHNYGLYEFTINCYK